MAKQTINATDNLPTGRSVVNANFTELYGRVVYPEDYGYTDAASQSTKNTAMQDWADAIAGGAFGATQYKDYLVSQTINFTTLMNVDMRGGNIKAVATFTGTEVVNIDINAQTRNQARISVDADGLGLDGIFIANAQAQDESLFLFTAKDCNDGIKIKGNVEGLTLHTWPVNCLDGVTMIESDDNLTTPDELLIYIHGRNNRTHYHVRGGEKSSATVIFNCAQGDVDNYAAVIIETGWHTLSGEIRGVKGGVEVTGAAQLIDLTGLTLVGKGDETDTNPALMVDATGCYIQGNLTLSGWNNKVWVKQCAGGKIHVGLRDADGSGGYGWRLGDAANAKTCQALYISGASGGDTYALHLDQAEGCVIDLQKITSTNTILISSTSSGNNINVSFFLRAKTVTNNRTELDNLITYDGTYTNAQLEEINGGTWIKGMAVKGSRDTNVYGRLFWNGSNWKSENGLTYNAGTNTWA